MNALILHHYPMSPYAEKIRAMLGYSGLAWQSAITREMPPRPVLAALAGGYRKIPVAQIGADVFCDTRLISAEIAALTGKPALCLEGVGEDEVAFARRTDNDLFFACVMHGNSLTMGRKVWNSMSVLDIGRFFRDRITMGRTASVPMMSMKEAGRALRAHLADLEQRLTQPFLFGDTPSIGDFTAYHGLWFIRFLAERDLINPYPRVLDWMDRLHGFGHGRYESLTGEQTLSIARAATPRSIAPEETRDPRIGEAVSITPSDYGQVASTGLLAGSTPTRWIIARDDAMAGRVHVHFPKDGYTLRTTSP